MPITHLDVDLDKSDKAGSHPPGFLICDFIKGRFDEAARSAGDRGKKDNDSVMRG